MAIFNKHGNLEPRPNDVVHQAANILWDKITPLLEGLSSVEARALEQTICLAISVRFSEHRIKTEMQTRNRLGKS